MAQGRSTKIISMIKWIRTSRLSINNSLSRQALPLFERALNLLDLNASTSATRKSIILPASQTTSSVKAVGGDEHTPSPQSTPAGCTGAPTPLPQHTLQKLSRSSRGAGGHSAGPFCTGFEPSLDALSLRSDVIS